MQRGEGAVRSGVVLVRAVEGMHERMDRQGGLAARIWLLLHVGRATAGGDDALLRNSRYAPSLVTASLNLCFDAALKFDRTARHWYEREARRLGATLMQRDRSRETSSQEEFVTRAVSGAYAVGGSSGLEGIGHNARG